MTPEKWQELGFKIHSLGPGTDSWEKTLPSGHSIIVDDASETESLPKEHGPFRIGLMKPDCDIVGYVIIGNDFPCIAEGKLSDELLIPVLQTLESTIVNI